MKLQHLAIIFIIVILPISMTMSSYIENQIDVIVLQTLYSKNLSSATYDAMNSFKINSVNNKYSSVSDSKIRDVEAAVKTFYNSLGASMNDHEYTSSKEKLSVFIPCLLFNMYDGYYINTSYNNVYKSTNSDAKVQIDNSSNDYQEGLKPYIYYSSEYNVNGKTVVVNYTLDNHITVFGDVGAGYEVRSGYLVNPNLISYNDATKTVYYNGVTIEPETLKEYLTTIEDGYVESGTYDYIVYKNQKVYKDHKQYNGENQYFWYVNNKKSYLQSEKENLEKYLDENTGGQFKSISAYEFYKEAYDFSVWLNNSNLANVKQSDIININTGGIVSDPAEYLGVNTGNEKIFNTNRSDNSNDPMLSGSVFNTHRMAIIRKSIETNLATTISNYNSTSGSGFDFVMPIIGEDDWYKITNNISIVSFMQGVPLGQKFFNSYSVVTNTKNEEVVNGQSLFIMTRDSAGNYEYHQPGCKKLIDDPGSIVGAYNALSFVRQTVKINEVSERYFYPQGIGTIEGKTTTGCYNCIVDATPDYNIDDIVSGTLTGCNTVRKVYLTALARERRDLYKSSDFNFD